MADSNSHKALGYALLAYITAAIAVVTLVPFEFVVPQKLQIALHGEVADVLTNILLFVPLGFFFQAALGRDGLKSLFRALCFGLLVSSTVEAGQLFLPSRNPSSIDVATNGFGTWLGAAIAAYQQFKVRQKRMPDLFGFGLPLISSVYLLVPLLWLGSISMGNEIDRLGLMILLGLFGGGVLSSAVVNRSRCNTIRARLMAAGYASIWFLVGAVPALVAFPLEIICGAVIVGVATQLSCWFWRPRNESDRRFELPTLRRLLPIYLIYLFFLSAWPTTTPLREWFGHSDFRTLDQAGRVLFIARFIEVIAAYTLLGFLVAEMFGRKDETATASLKRVFFCVSIFAAIATALLGFFSEPLYLLVEALLFTAAAMYGAIIYRLQLAAIQPR